MFWFVLVALVAAVAAVALVVVGSIDGADRTAHGGLADVTPDRLVDALPLDRPLSRADVAGVRLPMALRGYRMAEVDDLLDRLGAELAERDARIAELERAVAVGAVDNPGTAAATTEDARPPETDR